MISFIDGKDILFGYMINRKGYLFGIESHDPIPMCFPVIIHDRKDKRTVVLNNCKVIKCKIGKESKAITKIVFDASTAKCYYGRNVYYNNSGNKIIFI